MATNKQKALAKEILGNTSSTMKDAMLNAGYAEGTTITPSQVTQSKGWQELMEKYLPDEKLAIVHSEGLEATKPTNAAILLTKDGQTVRAEEQGLIETPDFPTRAKYLDMAYKIKGKSEPQTQVNILNQGGDMSLEFSEK